MPQTAAQKEATKKYRSTLKNISFQVKDAEYSAIADAAERSGLSFYEFVRAAIREKVERV